MKIKEVEGSFRDLASA